MTELQSVCVKNLDFHDAANIYPFMADDDFDALVEDIRKHGQRETIKLFEGKIIDGRNRYKACLLCDVKPIVEQITTDDPVAYVISLNSVRRHLNPSQLSMCAARAREFYEKQAKERQKRKSPDSVPENLPEQKNDARDAAGKAFNVSGKSVDYASKVLTKGTPELVKAVDEGKMAVSSAAILATEPPEVQIAEVSQPKRNRTYAPKSDTKQTETKGTEGRAQLANYVSDAMQFAKLAVLQLVRIKADDPKKAEAFAHVSNWMRDNA